MPKKSSTNTTSSLGGGVSTNYGYGTLPDGTKIYFLADVKDGVIDKLNATITSPTNLAGKRITRESLTASWRIV